MEDKAVSKIHEPGKARIKQEFTVNLPSRVPVTLRSDIVSKEENDNGPPAKRARGQNKHRPHAVHDKKEDCLCPSLVNDEGVCMYGENCKFIHDIKKYMELKPDDIASECYAFVTHGKCNYGITCRYGYCHIKKTEEGSYISVEDKEKIESNPALKIGNTLPRDLRISLRKKKYDFLKSNKIFSKKQSSSQKKKGKNPEGLTELGVPRSDESLDKIISEGNEISSRGQDLADSNSTCAALPKEDKATGSVNSGSITNEDLVATVNGEKRILDFRGKLFLAPLTTVGNLPFRVVCKSLGADITCSEMAMSSCLLQGNVSEWALLKRHPCEDIFGVQICGSFPDTMTRCAEMIENECSLDFLDINMGCPIDLVFNKGAGSALMQRTKRLFDIVKSMKKVMTIPLTCKMRTGIDNKKNNAHQIIPQLRDLGVSLCTVHGRSRQARYTKLADWEYVKSCTTYAAPMPLFGNGDILSFEDYNAAVVDNDIAGVMIARGALIKPWIFTEIKEQRHWDISSSERFDILRNYVNQGLMHWGSDSRGVETTRRFLLEWLSFFHRYIPVGVLEQVPQKINEKPPMYVGRNDLETLMADRNCKSWVKISEMLLGKVPDTFQFMPKHKANSYN